MITYGESAEELKPLHEIHLPDERFKIHAIGRNDQWRPMELSDLHRRVSSFVLSPSTPKDVRRQFDTARNLLVYTWFVYEFQGPASMHAYATLELALRTRFPDAVKPPNKKGEIKPLTLHPLLLRAKKDGAIDPAKIPFLQRRRARHAIHPYDHLGQPTQMMSDEEWFDHVIESIPSLRNGLAHGKPMLYLEAIISQLDLCADLINALFPGNAEANSPSSACETSS